MCVRVWVVSDAIYNIYIYINQDTTHVNKSKISFSPFSENPENIHAPHLQLIDGIFQV